MKTFVKIALAASLAFAAAVQAAPNVADVTARAEKGVVEAQYALGTMYLKGNGVEQNAQKAIEWYEKAAAQDNAMAMLKLGFMYEDGLGVEKNLALAKDWYEKACNLKHEFACSYYARLSDSTDWSKIPLPK